VLHVSQALSQRGQAMGTVVGDDDDRDGVGVDGVHEVIGISMVVQPDACIV